jgi:hypothetical protein
MMEAGLPVVKMPAEQPAAASAVEPAEAEAPAEK